MKRIYLNITGKVQGVGFRYFCNQQAENLSLKGWVKNEGDGSVSLEAEGDQQSLNKFFSVVSKGPHYSHVDSVKRKELPPISKEKNFSIRY